MNILIDATLPLIDESFPSPFVVTRYKDKKELAECMPNQSFLVCRANVTVNADTLQDSTLRVIATASSGTCHIDSAYLQTRNIEMLDAKGSNAQAVADYVLATLAYLQNAGINSGKKAGIIGVGAVGSLVLKYLEALGFEIYLYDPLREAREPNFISCKKEDLYDCDVITVHANLHDKVPHASRNLIDIDFLKALKPKTILINAARGGIVNESDILNTPTKPIYCTDVYLNEPEVNKAIVDYAHLCTPHIAGHSMEAKNNAVIQISQELHKKLNLPSPHQAHATKTTKPYEICDNWQHHVLSLYNPGIESEILKNALNVQETFLKLRSAHTFRHDFTLNTPMNPY